MISHHPTATTLLSYATGALPEVLGLVLATHLAQCASCRRSVATLEAVGGALLDALPPVALAPGATAADALDRLLARLDPPARADQGRVLDPAPPAGPPWTAGRPWLGDGVGPGVTPVLHPALPAPLNRIPMGRWWPIGFGVWWRPLRVAGAAWGGLILAQPGRSLPRHGHAGLELTCLLSGTFADTGSIYGPGDLAEPEADHDHPPVVTGTAPCLCVLASEGMRLHGALGLAQRLIGQ